jgi:hypothetical protein
MLAGSQVTMERAAAPMVPATAEAVLPQRLIYVSRARPGLGRADLYAIIRAAHVRNIAAGISGALIHLDGWFAQALEGPRAALSAAFARIAADPRHEALELRSRERALTPLFRGQAMALRDRACLDAGLLDTFGYRPGFPVATFPADVLVEFMVRACRQVESTRLRAH